jgi:hypothetical protein
MTWAQLVKNVYLAGDGVRVLGAMAPSGGQAAASSLFDLGLPFNKPTALAPCRDAAHVRARHRESLPWPHEQVAAIPDTTHLSLWSDYGRELRASVTDLMFARRETVPRHSPASVWDVVRADSAGLASQEIVAAASVTPIRVQAEYGAGSSETATDRVSEENSCG